MDLELGEYLVRRDARREGLERRGELRLPLLGLRIRLQSRTRHREQGEGHHRATESVVCSKHLFSPGCPKGDNSGLFPYGVVSGPSGRGAFLIASAM